MLGIFTKKSFLKNFIIVSIIFFMSISFLCLSASASSPTKVSGNGYTSKNNNTGSFSGQIDGTLTNGSTDIDVLAKTSGGTEIVYDLDISWGGMRFEYYNGNTWNPTTHTYSTGSHVLQNGGWVVNGLVNYINNAITVRNNSNFPMTADFSFTPVASTGNGQMQMNASPNSSGSVIGIFTDQPGSFNEAILKEGYGGTTTSAMTTANMTLEMDISNIASGQYYYKVGATTPGNTDFEKQMYFALSGKPDTGFSRDYTNVGKITIQIAPVTGATKVDVP